MFKILRKQLFSTVSKAFVRQAAPAFEGMSYFNNGFKKISLNDYKGKYVCLFFYPLDFTFVCPTEIIQFSDRVKEFNERNCEVVGCSIDSHFSHMNYSLMPRNQGGLGQLQIPLLADLTKQISKDYGCLLPEGFALRATYIIDEKGVLRHQQQNDLPVGRNVDEILRLVDAFQYVDKNGEVSNWKKGGPTMKPDMGSNETKQYWQKVHAKK